MRCFKRENAATKGKKWLAEKIFNLISKIYASISNRLQVSLKLFRNDCFDFFCLTGTDRGSFAGFRACKCLNNSYRLNLFGVCSPCGTFGLKCQDEFANLSVGYWWHWKDKTHLELYRNFSKNVKNFSFTPELHKGNDSGIEYPYTLPQPHRCLMADVCKGGLNSSCEAGYKGPLCAVCSDGYYKQLTKCKLCPTKKWMIGQCAIIGALVMILVILVVWRSKKKCKKDAGRSFLDEVLGRIKVIIGFYQVTFGIMEAFSYIKWPESLNVIGQFSQVMQINILQIAPPHCILPGLGVDALGSLLATMGLNIAAVIIALTGLALAYWTSTRHMLNEEEKMKKKERVKGVVKRSLFFFLYLTYLNTCLKTVQVLPLTCHKICVDQKDESCVEYLKADYSIDCKGERYKRLVIVGYCSIVYVIFLPAAAFIAIWKRQRAAREAEDETTDDTNDFKGQGTMETGLRFLHESYTSRCWYWELVETCRKVILTSGLILLDSENRGYIGLALLSSGFYGIYFALKRPINDPFENKLMLSSLAVTFVNLAIGAVSTIPSEGFGTSVDPIVDNLMFNILVIVANSLVIGLLVGKLTLSCTLFVCHKSSYILLAGSYLNWGAMICLVKVLAMKGT